MGRRKNLNPNADPPSSPSGSAPADPYARDSEWSTPTAEMERQETRDVAASTAAALQETMTEREAAARREVPRTITDAANPRMNRSFAGESAERPMLSSNMQKSLNVAKRAWSNDLPKTRHASMTRTAGNQEMMEGVNSALRAQTGMRSKLTPALRRRVSELDRSIQDFERQNQRQHIVYATLRAPKNHGNSRAAVNRSLERLAESDSDKATLTFDGYIPATHSLGNINDGPDIVMEIRTRSGAYLGSSDTTPNSDHIVGRGRVLRPVSVQSVSYVKPDGSRGTRKVVQMDDVTPE